MGIHINRITVGTPTGLTPTLQAGGALTPGTTYYYRAIAVRFYASKVLVFSAPCAEVSTTPDAVNKTVSLAWAPVANADGYIIQRTTTSGSYPVEGNNTLRLVNQSWSGQPTATTQTSLVDDGGAALNVRFDCANLDHSREIPAIDCYGDSVADVITLADVIAADRAGGWGDLSIIGSSGLAASSDATWLEEAPYLLLGSLYSHLCTFRLRGMLIVYGGAYYFDSNSKIEFGHATSNYMPYLFHIGPRFVNYTNDGNTRAGYWLTNKIIYGLSGSFATLLIDRPIIAKNSSLFGYVNPAEKLGANIVLSESIIGQKVDGSLEYALLEGSKNIFESINPQVAIPIMDTKVRLSSDYGFNSLWTWNTKLIRPESARNIYDITWGNRGGMCEVDGKWGAKGQTDNQPYYNVANNPGYTLLRCNSFKTKVVAQDGSPLSGAVVTLIDALGNSDLWVDSEAIFTSYLNNTDITSSLTVSDGSKFVIGNIIRNETYGEIYQVTNVVGNTLTITRGYGGTAKRTTNYVYSYGCRRILKQLASLTADADGIIEAVEYVIAKEVEVLASGTGYESDLVTAGKIQLNMRTPHTLTITKDGYQDYRGVITVDRKMDLEVALSPVPSPVYVNVPSGEMNISLAAPARLEVALEADEIKVEIDDE